MVITKLPLFAGETAQNMFYNFVVFFFVCKKRREKILSVRSFFIAGETLDVSREHVLGWEKFLCAQVRDLAGVNSMRARQNLGGNTL